jgi:hypothetical protein
VSIRSTLPCFSAIPLSKKMILTSHLFELKLQQSNSMAPSLSPSKNVLVLPPFCWHVLPFFFRFATPTVSGFLAPPGQKQMEDKPASIAPPNWFSRAFFQWKKYYIQYHPISNTPGPSALFLTTRNRVLRFLPGRQLSTTSFGCHFHNQKRLVTPKNSFIMRLEPPDRVYNRLISGQIYLYRLSTTYLVSAGAFTLEYISYSIETSFEHFQIIRPLFCLISCFAISPIFGNFRTLAQL